MTPKARLQLFLAAIVGLGGLYLWGLAGLPGFGRYPGPYGTIVASHAIKQAGATGVVSAVNFDYRGFDTLGEEFILFASATGIGTVLRRLRGESRGLPVDQVGAGERPATSDAVRVVAVLLVGPMVLYGWYLASHAQTSPAGGFQGGVVLASAVVLVYLGGQFRAFRRLTATSFFETAEAVGAGSFAAIGLSALAYGLAYLTDLLPLGQHPGAVDSSGTIALISFFVGVEVCAAFVMMVAELLEQALVVRKRGS